LRGRDKIKTTTRKKREDSQSKPGAEEGTLQKKIIFRTLVPPTKGGEGERAATQRRKGISATHGDYPTTDVQSAMGKGKPDATHGD